LLEFLALLFQRLELLLHLLHGGIEVRLQRLEETAEQIRVRPSAKVPDTASDSQCPLTLPANSCERSLQAAAKGPWHSLPVITDDPDLEHSDATKALICCAERVAGLSDGSARGRRHPSIWKVCHGPSLSPSQALSSGFKSRVFRVPAAAGTRGRPARLSALSPSLPRPIRRLRT